MSRGIGVAVMICVTLSVGTHAWAQEGISVFEGGGEGDGPIQIGGGTSTESEPRAGGLVIEGAGGASASSGQGWGAEATLPFVEQGGVMFVPAKIAGKRAYFIFDTGAGLSTLTPSFAKKIGAAPGKDSPRMTTMTANGPSQTRLSVARSMSLANIPLGAFTFSTCVPCGGGTIKGAPVVGLLGRNVLSRIDFRVDDGAGSIKIRLKPGHKNQRRDIERWLGYGFERGGEPNQAVFVLENRAPRALKNATFTMECQTRGEGSFTREISFGRVSSRKTKKKKVRVTKSNTNDAQCVSPSITLRAASW